ncbi:MAG: hypothetical protein LH629_13130 [Ignavibacteria bacterium]|nr:hypothetical protein [Ignavibacteria bacterium]
MKNIKCKSKGGSNSSSNNSSSENKVDAASATNTLNIFNLASTGNIVFVISIFLLGIALILTGIAVSRKRV